MQAYGSVVRRVARWHPRALLALVLAATLAGGLVAAPGVSSTVAPAPVTVTLAIAGGGNDVNEDGSTFSAGGTTIWVGNGGSTTASYTGLRFTSVGLPRGATVTSAHLELVSSTTQWLSLSFSITAEAADSSAEFTTASRPSQRPLTAQRVNHSSNLRWQSGVTYSLDEMAAVVQEVVNRPGWQPGNSLSVILKGTGSSWGRKFVRSVESGAASAPRLVITYDAPASGGTSTPTPTALPPTSTSSPTFAPPTSTPSLTATAAAATATATSTSLPTRTPSPTPSQTPTLAAAATSTPTLAPSPTATPTPGAGPVTLNRLVATSADDVNEDGASFESGSTTIWLGTGGAGAGATFTGLRFTGVAVPPGATVLSAHLEVTSSQTQWNTMDFVLAADAADDSPAFSTTSRPSQRSLTGHQVSHSSDSQWLAGTTYSLDEMAAVVQEVVSRPGWQSGNSLSLIVKGTGQPWSRKFAVSFDGGATRAPRLVITYTTSVGPSPTTTPVATSTPPPDAATLGQWSTVRNWPLVAVHAALQPSGEVLVWDAWELGSTPSARLWNPVTETFVSVPNPFAAVFCAGLALLGDGRLLVVGGHNGADTGIFDATIFDSASRTWLHAASMAYARWYPTALTLPDGRVLALSGNQTPTGFATTPEVYDPAANAWTQLAGATLLLPTYPQAHVAPDGRVFLAGTEAQAPRSRFLDVASQTWTTLGPAPINGVTVMYQPGRILMTGGGDPSSAQAFVIDLNQPSPAWRAVAPMAFARNFHNQTILPDGTVLVTGGGASASLVATSGGALAAELWDPATESFTTLASMQVPRLYHSIGLLLPDGRVLVAGGGRTAPAIDYLSAEIYSPPYLFRGPRPGLTSAPDRAAYGATITVQTADAASITRVSLIRASAATHTLNTDQRYLSLAFTPVAGGLQVTMPASPNLAPPGPYLLFLLNSNGVPSIGHFVILNQGGAGLRTAASAPGLAGGAEVPTPPGQLAARWVVVEGAPAVALRWADRSDDEAGFLVERAADPRFTREVVRFAVAANATAYTDATAPARRVSYYRVVALGRTGVRSAASNLARVTPLPGG